VKHISGFSFFALMVFMSSLTSAVSAQDASSSIAQPDTASIQQTVTVAQIFEQGLAAIDDGNFGNAAAAFRAILSVYPNHVPARRALVGVLIKTGNYDAAEFHLHELLKTDTGLRNQDTYLKSLDKIVRTEPLSFSGSFAILPSTNVNNGTQNVYFNSDLGQFIIDESSREASGFGLNAGVGGSYRWALGGGQTLKMTASLSGVWYEIETLRHVDAAVAFSYQKETAKTHWSIGPYVRRSWYAPVYTGNNSDNIAQGISFSYTHHISPSNEITFDTRFEEQSHLEKTYFSGLFLSSTLKLEHSLNSKTQYTLTFGAQRYEPEAAQMAYQGLSVTAGVNTVWRNSMITGVSVGLGNRNYDANHTSLPFPREDDYYSIGLTAQNNKFEIFGIVPQFGCTYKRNLSNVAFYDYQTTDCKIVLTRNF